MWVLVLDVGNLDSEAMKMGEIVLKSLSLCWALMKGMDVKIKRKGRNNAWFLSLFGGLNPIVRRCEEVGLDKELV